MKKFFRSAKYWVLLIVATTIFALPGAQAERIYKWTDGDGNIVYSQTPPPRGIKAERIKGAPPPPEDPEKVMKELREKTEAFGQRRDDRMLVAKEGEEALEKKRQTDKICAQLRKNLETLQTNTRIREKVEGQEPVAIGEEQRQAKIKSTQERIQKECTNN